MTTRKYPAIDADPTLAEIVLSIITTCGICVIAVFLIATTGA